MILMAYTIFCDEGVTFTAAELLNVHFAQVKDRRFLEAMERRGGDLYVITMSPAFSDSYQAACEARDTLLSGGTGCAGRLERLIPALLRQGFRRS